MSYLLEFNLSLVMFLSSVYILVRLIDRPKKKRSYGRGGAATGIYKWKRSVRSRVYELHKSGHSTRQITKLTSIPKSTVHQIIQEQKNLMS
tara:strand:+ start:159 stop:431 length:273 start_codon:yes stop_codon:yes gene_type:complete